MEVILGIDIGGSTTKIVGLRTDGSVISMLRVRAEDQVTSLYGALRNYLTSNGLSLGDVRRVVLTGVGASYVDGDVFGLPTCRVDEFQASGTGALALSGQSSGVVVTMGTGTLWVDCAQLEVGSVPNRYNLLRNCDFSLNSSGVPTFWTANGSNTSGDAIVTSADDLHPSFLTNNRMRLYGDPQTNKGIYQDLPVSGSQGDVYVAGGWAKGFSRPIGDDKRHFGIRVAFKNGSGAYENGEILNWNEEWTDWQYVSGAVIAPCAYTGIRFNVDYEKNVNYADFDGMTLYKEEFGNTFTYDDDGNVTEEALLDAEVKPMVNQLLIHIGNTPAALLAYCREQGIVVEAYSPIAHGEALKNETIAAMAQKYGASAAQLCIQYVLQLGTVALPKTANPAHMRDNANLHFELSNEDMERLRALDFKDYGAYSRFPVFSGK